MADPHDAAAQTLAAREVERVLRAEHDAVGELDAARDAARQALALARDEALATVNRAAERAARWQQRHAEALRRRLDALRVQGVRAADARVQPGEEAITAAARAVAAQMTMAGEPKPTDDGRP